MSTVLDPLDDAVQVAESAGQFFGKLEVSGQFVVLRKGERKRAWVEGDDTDGRVTEVTLRLNPHDITNMTRLVERQVLANSGEWSRIVWSSLRELGFKSLREVDGKWGHIQLVKNGESYQNREGKTVEKTTFKFLGVFNTEAELIESYEKLHGSQPGAQRQTGSAPGVEAAPPNEIEKAVAAQFLPSLVNMAKGDRQALAQSLASMAPVNRYFTIDSPEVQQLLTAV